MFVKIQKAKDFIFKKNSLKQFISTKGPIIHAEDFSVEQMQYIDGLQQMKYPELVKEYKRQSRMSGYTTKKNMIQYLIDNISKSEIKISDIKKEDISLELESLGYELENDDNNLENFEEIFEEIQDSIQFDFCDLNEKIKQEIKESHLSQLQNFLVGSECLSEREAFFGKLIDKFQEIYYGVKSNDKQIMDQFTEKGLKDSAIKKDFKFLIQNYEIFDQKNVFSYTSTSEGRKSIDKNAKKIFIDSLLLEHEYQKNPKNKIFQLMQEIRQNKFKIQTLLQVSKELSHPNLYHKSASIFTYCSNTIKNIIWKLITKELIGKIFQQIIINQLNII